MSTFDSIKQAFKERYQAELDVGIVLGFKEDDLFSVADVVFDRDGKEVAVKIVREDDTIESISQFFGQCQSEGYYPLFLFRSPNSSPQAVVCSYLNSAAFAVDEALRITPFKIDKEGLKVSTKTFSIEDFKCRKKYYINYPISIFGFSLPKDHYRNFFLDMKTEYCILERDRWKKTEEKPVSDGENRKKTSLYDEKELQELFLAMDYENLFKKLYPVIRYGLNMTIEDEYSKEDMEDMIHDVCEIIWKKIQDEEIRKSGSLGAFTISVSRFYLLNLRRKEAGRQIIQKQIAALIDVYRDSVSDSEYYLQ